MCIRDSPMNSDSDLRNPYHIALEAVGHKLIRDKDGMKTWCIHCADTPEPCSGEVAP